MTDLAGHFLVFTAVGIAALFVPLILGRLIRPHAPTREKVAVYECGEPTIGTSYIQFDLRFYVVALLFIVFDVEVAFFFPWAAVFGNATQLADTRIAADSPVRRELSEILLNVPAGTLPADGAVGAEAALRLGWTAFVDILVFFAVLLVGFAYIWKRGDLDWVRAIQSEAVPADEGPALAARRELTTVA